ncbi:MAG: selenoprotein B, partial [Gammaproteobacteria bacterium]|nr:selenoprotein B [Gammaproteobacteria bacterium]
MCHQSVGLIAREIEARGIPTICMSSAYSITASVNPPRAAYLDFPLGHTAGKPNDKPLQRKIMIDTLSALDSIQVPGTIRELGYEWSDDD